MEFCEFFFYYAFVFGGDVAKYFVRVVFYVFVGDDVLVIFIVCYCSCKCFVIFICYFIMYVIG